jgi:hypothetical protein
LFCFDAHTLRGVGSDYVVVDEGAFMPPAIFFVIIVPLLLLALAVLIMISTLLDELNYFSLLMKDVDHLGNPLFIVFRQELICERCKQREDPWKCRHKMHLIPSWKSQKTLKTCMKIYKNDHKTMMRETMYVTSITRVSG